MLTIFIHLSLKGYALSTQPFLSAFCRYLHFMATFAPESFPKIIIRGRPLLPFPIILSYKIF